MSRDIEDRISRWSRVRLVVSAGVEPEAPQWGAVESDDLDVSVGDEHRHRPALIGMAHPDVVQLGSRRRADRSPHLRDLI